MKTGMPMPMPATPGGQASNVTSAAGAGSSTPNTAAGVGGSTGQSASVIANFWNNHAMPATSCGGAEGGGDGATPNNNVAVSPSSASSPAPSASASASPLSTSARAAADAVLGMISRAEAFIGVATGVSPASGTGFCSPRGSPRSSTSELVATMDRIPEGDDDEGTAGENDPNNVTATDFGGCDGRCFEFEDFGFNAFQDGGAGGGGKQQQQRGGAARGSPAADGGSGGVQTRPSQPASAGSPPEQMSPSKGYEIRLKSTFSQIKAQEEMDQSRQQQPMQPFGRTHPNYKKSMSNEATAQQQHHHAAEQEHDDVPLGGSSRALPDGLPFRELSVPTEIERSVSELTMRSHGAFERHRYTSDSRRMAYYAVGRTPPPSEGGDGKPSGGGGNRRCYFTGSAIPYGMPFYAGSVQQGPRTLVVFCLPSSLGLPLFEGLGGGADGKGSGAADTRESYLESLPQPDAALLEQMSRRYPEPFDTLPVQVRSPHCWRLFVKFCFFSGLPIAEGEMHYRVKALVSVFPSAVAPQHQDEEIALSHEVMEGECALWE